MRNEMGMIWEGKLSYFCVHYGFFPGGTEESLCNKFVRMSDLRKGEATGG
jgi:hypothetical protein